jgi:hypothetical protein
VGLLATSAIVPQEPACGGRVGDTAQQDASHRGRLAVPWSEGSGNGRIRRRTPRRSPACAKAAGSTCARTLCSTSRFGAGSTDASRFRRGGRPPGLGPGTRRQRHTGHGCGRGCVGRPCRRRHRAAAQRPAVRHLRPGPLPPPAGPRPDSLLGGHLMVLTALPVPDAAQSPFPSPAQRCRLSATPSPSSRPARGSRHTAWDPRAPARGAAGRGGTTRSCRCAGRRARRPGRRRGPRALCRDDPGDPATRHPHELVTSCPRR